MARKEQKKIEHNIIQQNTLKITIEKNPNRTEYNRIRQKRIEQNVREENKVELSRVEQRAIMISFDGHSVRT